MSHLEPSTPQSLIFYALTICRLLQKEASLMWLRMHQSIGIKKSLGSNLVLCPFSRIITVLGSSLGPVT